MAKDKKPKCGLCGKTENLIKTECCNEWICNDEDQYVAFTFARNSCHRNHRRLTLCAFHYDNDHDGDWTDCEECKNGFDTEDYVNYGTNEYNFKKLSNPPSFESTRCYMCNTVINRMIDEYVMTKDGFCCSSCGVASCEK